MAATVIGAPIAGAILLARNYSALGNRTASRKALLWGSVGTTALLVLAYFLPEGFPSTGIPIGYSVGMYYSAKQLQGDLFKSHLARGGAKGSTWFAVAIGTLSLLAIVALLVGVIVVGAVGEP